MKSYVYTVFSLFLSCSAFAQQPPVYVIPGSIVIPGGFHFNMYVNNQGPFSAEIDTGSANFMVPGDLKTCPTCNTPNGISPTGKLGPKFTVSYGTGRILIAHRYTTTVQPAVGNSTPTVMQTLGLVTAVSGNDNSSPILGMEQPAFVLKSRYGQLTTYMQALMNAGVTKDLGFMLVGCRAGLAGTEMVLGGPDPRLKGTAPITEPLLGKEIRYVITPSTFGIVKPGGNESILGYFNPPTAETFPGIVIDSGSSNIRLASQLYHPLIKALKAASPSIPAIFWMNRPAVISAQQLASLPTLVLNFKDGKTLTISPASYVVPVAFDGTQTKSQLMITDTGTTYTVFGDALFTSYAMYFNRSTESLGFYPNTAICV